MSKFQHPTHLLKFGEVRPKECGVYYSVYSCLPFVVILATLLVMSHGGAIGLGGLGLGGGLGVGGGIGLGGLGLGTGIGLGGISTIGTAGIGISRGVDLYAPPKYEYQYAVRDALTGDLKEQAESRIGDLTKDEYATAEKDRAIRVSRIIAG
ncbi:hypothetical protein NQ317_003031 [Molorchus minor]|uniref:Uncharacterized protein n=1 Tax=Molorchus minor TaxID=1323400 RepID=A0ABQ9JH62_9CUCU|nr:hypothetical protein NQ317_003031 [Molorchus minor]